MKIGILGFGSIGKLVFASLSLNKELEVSYIDERSHARSQCGFTYKDLATNKTQYLIANRVLDLNALDLIILTTKTYQTKSALTNISLETPLVILQNGMGNEEQIKNPYILATTDCGAYVSENILNISHLGTITYDQHNALNLDLSFLSTSLIPWNPTDQINLMLFRKLVINAVINPITALYQIKNGEIFQYKALCNKLLDEIALISHRAHYPFSREELENFVYSVAQKTKDNYSSMCVDVKNKRRTEIDNIVGYLLKLASAYNIDPINLKMIYNQIAKYN